MSDLISILSEIRSSYNCFDEKEEPYYRALGEAIRLVSAQPEKRTEERTKMCDLIRRSDAIKAVAEHFAFEAEMETTYEYSWEDYKDVAESILSRAETVRIERRGRWLEEHNHGLGRKLRDLIICSECGSAFTSEDLLRRSYCPNCGALMDCALFVGLSSGGVLIKIPEVKE